MFGSKCGLFAENHFLLKRRVVSRVRGMRKGIVVDETQERESNRMLYYHCSKLGGELMAKVSVVMPAYNAEKSIQQAVESVMKQSYKDIELIVVNDGSQDDTGQLLDKLKLSDDRLNVIHIQNSGVSNARNIGINQCTGEFVAFIDSDDSMNSKMIEILIKQMKQDIDLVCCGYMIKSTDGSTSFSQEPQRSIWNRDVLYDGIADLQDKKAFNVLWNKLFRLDIIKDSHIMMNPKVKMGEDFLFIVDYLKNTSGNMSCIPDVLYNYILSPGGAQATLNVNAEANLERRISQLLELKKLYKGSNYPLDGIYAEQLRCLYTTLMECSDTKGVLWKVHEDRRFEELLSHYNPLGKKYKIFIKLVRSRNSFLVRAAVKMFSLIKKYRGKSYAWS